MAEDEEREAAYFARITAKKSATVNTHNNPRPATGTASSLGVKQQPNLDNATLRTKTFAKEDARIEGAEEARLNRLMQKGPQVPNIQKSNEPYTEESSVSLSAPRPPVVTPAVEESTTVNLSLHSPKQNPAKQVFVLQAPTPSTSPPSNRDGHSPRGKSSREPSPRSKTSKDPSPRSKASKESSPRTKTSRDPSPRSSSSKVHRSKTMRDPSPRSESSSSHGKRSSRDPSPRSKSTKRDESTPSTRSGGNSFAARQAMFEQAGKQQDPAPPPSKNSFAGRQAMFEKAAQASTEPVVKKKATDVPRSPRSAAAIVSSAPIVRNAEPKTHSSPTPLKPAPNAGKPAYNTMPAKRPPAGARQLPDWQQVPHGQQHNTKYESMLLAEILSARQNPQSLISALKSRILGFVGKNYLDPVSNCFMQTVEGEAAVLEAITFLHNQPPVKQSLTLEEGLSLSARDFCVFNSSTDEITESNEHATARLTKYGDFSGELFQNVCYTNLPPEDMVQSWIIDDGNTGNRVNREALFNTDIKVIGIASGPHGPNERVVCVLLAGGYEFGAVSNTETNIQVVGGQYQPAAVASKAPPSQQAATTNSQQAAAAPKPQQAAAAPKPQQAAAAPKPQQSHAPTNAKPGWNTLKTAAAGSPPLVPAPAKKYPALTVGKLQHIDANTATELIISNLGCKETDLVVELRDNGTQLAFQRTCSSEGRLMGLPYPVTSSSCTATYSPNDNGGSLRLRFGKPSIPDYDVCEFFVKGEPGSTAERAVMQVISSNPTCYEFTPGPAMAIDTNFIVKMSGTTLSFRTEPQCSTQTVNLPVPITRNQIECIDLAPGKGKTIKIWHQKPAELHINQPNCTIPINVA